MNIKGVTTVAVIPFFIHFSHEEDMGLAKEIKYFLIQRLLTSPAYHLFRIYAKTIRITFEGDGPVLDHLKAGHRVLFACWHQRFFGGFYFPERYQLKPCIMISQSRDGDFIAAVVERMDWLPVRGSSSRGGKAALWNMSEWLVKQTVGAHIVDGPTGPPRVIKPGLLSIARNAGAAVCPAYVVYERCWIVNSWDRFMIPKPFSRVLIRFGDLFTVPADLDPESFEHLRQTIETAMIREYDVLDRCWAN
jgi:lysophospholipid acyltransferase (LPLAT)-like uncharacterized protein